VITKHGSTTQDVVAAGFAVDRRERLRAGIVKRVRAFKPTDR
jgi:hypothetical protein